ncbi:MAG: peptidase, partial [Gammaproteobacteria bacterium RIFCSPHIGHO2_12_FULL_45_9]
MKKRRVSRTLGHVLWALISLCLTVVLGCGLAYFYLAADLPDVDTLKDAHLQVPLRIYTQDGRLMATFGASRRIPVTLDQIPQQLIHAVLATEDARFYDHPGIDFVGLVRAGIAVVTTGRKVQGASTITMQVARNFYLSREKTYSRKIREILLALKINRELPKDKILELYLNKIYFGSRAYGVAAAAQVYYGKQLNQLTLPEIAMIAGLPQAPSRSNPLENPEAALKRRNHVLERLYTLGYITASQYQEAVAAPETAKYHREPIEVQAPYVAEMVREAMVAEYGELAYEEGFSVYTTVNTTLQNMAGSALRIGLLAYDKRHGYRGPEERLGLADPAVWLSALRNHAEVNGLWPAVVTDVNTQSIQVLLSSGREVTIGWDGLSWARRALKDGLVDGAPEQASEIVAVGDVVRVEHTPQGTWMLSQTPEVQGALVSLNPVSGAIVALTGGFSYALSSFNRAVQAERQPGSNFKPFLYSAALDKGYTLATLVNDAPFVGIGATPGSVWRPMNDEKKFNGPTPLRMGLVKSLNLVSIRVLQGVGVRYAIRYFDKFGFDTHRFPPTLSLALGTGEVTPLQLAAGYAIFANGGFRVTPYFIESIRDQTGKLIYTAHPPIACELCLSEPTLPPTDQPNPMAPEAISPQTAYLMTQALRDVIRSGTARAALVLKRSDLAGKTGTTNNKVNAWFSGFNSRLVATVWVGFDDLKPLHEYGADVALPIWIDYMGNALAGTPSATMPEPPGIVTVRI